MSRRRVAALLLATVALAGCGAKPEPDLSKLAVTGTVDVSPAPGAPDAGTVAGHRAGVAATTRHTLFRFVGRVKPPGADVTLTPPAGRAASVRRKAHGSFSAEVRKLHRGANRFVLRGTTPGLRPWTLPVSVTRE
jgi:hypothetical protein